jgi:hypothetical protein
MDLSANLRPRHLEQYFGDILDLFLFLPELHCSVILTHVVFSLSPLFTSVHSRSYDSTFDSNLHILFTRSTRSMSSQNWVDWDTEVAHLLIFSSSLLGNQFASTRMHAGHLFNAANIALHFD